jgi:hypothetical protein
MSAEAGSGIVINRTELSAQQVAQLEQRLGTQLLQGRYWYDRRSGLWGREGMANAGQLPAWLPVTAPLPSDISTGGTGVYVNGREIHPQEYLYLVAVYGSVIPGRYWLDANGTAGFEGGPAAYNLFNTGRGYNASTSGGHNWRGGSVIGGGGTTGFIGTDGTSVICDGGGCSYN